MTTASSVGGSENQPSASSDRTLATHRHLAASPNQVYAAFVSAERLARMWGPSGFRNTFQVFDPRPGGAWRFVMHAPDGAEFPNESEFEALVPGERIAIRHASGPRFTLTIALAAERDGTRLTWTQVFDLAKDYEAVRRFAAAANEENLDRIEAELRRA